MEKNSSIQTYRANATWINITQFKKEEIAYLKKTFQFFLSDIKDVLPPLQRPKVKERPGYIFMILVLPIYRRDTRMILPTELDLFLTKDTLITIHSNNFKTLQDISAYFKKEKLAPEKFLAVSPITFLFEILERIYESLFPMLTHLSNDINELGENIFEDRDPNLIARILEIKRNIIAFRKALSAHKRALKQLEEIIPRFSPLDAGVPSRLEEIIEHTREIWDELDNYAYTISAIHESHESITTHKLNIIIKTLTMFSVIVFPLTLLAAIFGMNTVQTPFVNRPDGFWIIIILMCIGTLSLLGIFKWKRWL